MKTLIIILIIAVYLIFPIKEIYVDRKRIWNLFKTEAEKIKKLTRNRTEEIVFVSSFVILASLISIIIILAWPIGQVTGYFKNKLHKSKKED